MPAAVPLHPVAGAHGAICSGGRPRRRGPRRPFELRRRRDQERGNAADDAGAVGCLPVGAAQSAGYGAQLHAVVQDGGVCAEARPLLTRVNLACVHIRQGTFQGTMQEHFPSERVEETCRVQCYALTIHERSAQGQ